MQNISNAVSASTWYSQTVFTEPGFFEI